MLKMYDASKVGFGTFTKHSVDPFQYYAGAGSTLIETLGLTGREFKHFLL